MSKIDFSKVVTAEDHVAAEAARVAEARRIEAQTLLATTDWYVTRKAETGAAIPKDVAGARRTARVLLSGDDA